MGDRRREALSVQTTDGWRLEVLRLRATDEPRGRVLLLHAMMVDRRTFDRPRGRGLASRLVSSGFDVWLADFRGHGSSRPWAGEGGRWSYDDLVRYDLPALASRMREEGDELPILVVGHSLGGHVAVAAWGTGRVQPAALVCLSTNVWLPRFEQSRVRRLAKAGSIAAFERVTRAAGYFPARRLGIGSDDEALDYVLDLCRFWKEDSWSARDGENYLAGMARIEGPVLSVVGRADRLMAEPEAAQRWVTQIPGLAFWRVGRGDSGLAFDPGHMQLVTDPRARPLWERLARWLAAQC